MGQTESNSFDVISINRKSIFTLDEARMLFPVIFKLTKSYANRVQALIEKIESLGKSRSEIEASITEPYEAEAGRLIQEWQSKVQKLGGFPNGHWVVDFDSGDGYFCWKFPEPEIEYWHHYRDGFSKRIKLNALRSDSKLTPVESSSRLAVEPSV